ncbi:MAG: glycerophosphodiester phosphodiesterase, partial [Acidimicrobiia bacterium]|nr:glycerophosphodiester phosphodiesterase [Acidimicrobiia bacterium]
MTRRLRGSIPVTRWRRLALLVPAAFVALVASAYLVALLTSRLDTAPIDRPPFFAARDGEHEPLVFAHQGGEALAPSNTMVAFTNATVLGADVLDADLHLTADGVPVLIHDTTVDRTSDGSGAVADLTLAELRALDVGYRFTTDGGDTYPFRGRGVGIVTVEELFAQFPDGRFNIEIKRTAPEAATVFCDSIRRFGREDQVVVSSFGQDNMDAFRSACPEVATAATEDEVRSFYILHRLGLTGLVGGLGDPPYQSLQVPEYDGDRLILSEGFVAAARALGLPVVPWTINDAADLER